MHVLYTRARPVQVTGQNLCNGRPPTYKYMFLTQKQTPVSLSPCSQVSYKRPCKAPGCCQSLTHAVVLGKLCSQLLQPTARQMAELRRPSSLSLPCLGNKVSQVLNVWITTHWDTLWDSCKLLMRANTAGSIISDVQWINLHLPLQTAWNFSWAFELFIHHGRAVLFGTCWTGHHITDRSQPGLNPWQLMCHVKSFLE